MKDRQKVDLPPACSPSFHVALTLTSLWLSGSLTSSCSANININSVIMASRITSLPWYAFLFSFFLFPLPPNLPLCLSLPSSHSGQSGQRTDNHHYKRWTRRWECLIFISRGVILLPKKKIPFEHFHAWFQTARVFYWDTRCCLLLYAAPGSWLNASSCYFDQRAAVIVWLRQRAFAPFTEVKGMNQSLVAFW